MMTWYTYGTVPVYDPLTDVVTENATGGKFVSAKDGAAIPIYDLNHTPITTLTSNGSGMSLPFTVQDVLTGLVQFGEMVVTVWANEVGDLALEAAGAQEIAATANDTATSALAGVRALETAGVALPDGGRTGDFLAWKAPHQGEWAVPPAGGGGSSDWAAITNKPNTFPPSGHTHTASQIDNSTSVGRALITSADAPTARAAIGAGTGNGTSDLQLGTSGATAAPGNHVHSATQVGFTPVPGLSATNVQDAITQAAAGAGGGGGGGTSGIIPWVYNGGWPVMPTTKPDGAVLVMVCGPSSPPSYPTWMGNGAGQVPTKVSLWP
jgi:hypothetical protein